MKAIINLHSIGEIKKLDTSINIKHPLIAIVDFSKIDVYIEEGARISFDFYAVICKNYCNYSLRYGRQTIDFQEGSLICLAPRQIITVESVIEREENMSGWGLFFHTDLIRGTHLTDKIKIYTFFHYEISEALHLSEKEKNILYDCIKRINNELEENIDSFSQDIIVTNIELLLNYIARFYGRQFITRKSRNKDIISKLESLLHTYINSELIEKYGPPSVKYLAENVHLSTNYLSDLLKKETGMSAIEYINFFIIEEAKNRLLISNESISEIAYSLGFEYPQYFARIFKRKTGMTPTEFRSKN